MGGQNLDFFGNTIPMRAVVGIAEVENNIDAFWACYFKPEPEGKRGIDLKPRAEWMLGLNLTFIFRLKLRGRLTVRRQIVATLPQQLRDDLNQYGYETVFNTIPPIAMRRLSYKIASQFAAYVGDQYFGAFVQRAELHKAYMERIPALGWIPPDAVNDNLPEAKALRP